MKTSCHYCGKPCTSDYRCLDKYAPKPAAHKPVRYAHNKCYRKALAEMKEPE